MWQGCQRAFQALPSGLDSRHPLRARLSERKGAEQVSTEEKNDGLRASGARTALINRDVLTANDNAFADNAAKLAA